ncbi:MAG TPA: tetratricopeptide repeat protein [Saprospiraceae bacterium]|nr:tetratricopeptide repeat protein [Saprospiraceae bacterium]
MNAFEKYFQGKLPPEEQEELAKKRQDPAFEAEFQSYQRAFRAIQYQGEKELKAHLQIKEKSLNGGRSRQQTRRLARRVLQIAAILVLSLLAVLLWPRQPSAERYLSTYFTPALNTALPNLRGEPAPDMGSPLQNALTAYNQKDYRAAIEQFQLIDRDSLQDIAHFYQANAHLALENSGPAIPLLQGLVQKENNYQYQSRWYLALAYLENGQTASAKALLEQLRLEQGSYQREAARILLELD